MRPPTYKACFFGFSWVNWRTGKTHYVLIDTPVMPALSYAEGSRYIGVW